MQNKVIIALIIALLAVPPVADAAWGGKGSWEPDTKLDKDGGWMYQNPDTTPVTRVPPIRQVYFNGFVGQIVGYLPSVNTYFNPNVATLQTAHPSYPDTARAMLGVWKDCNRDGYIGYGDNGLFEYRVELLPAGGPCPAQAIPNPVPSTWFPVHNDGQWVHEFIPILYEDSPEPVDTNIWNLVDTGARMWMDDGNPGAPPSGTCYTTAHPPGTYHSVGGLVNLADCYLTNRVNENGTKTFCQIGSCATWETIKATRNPWGEETDGSYAYVWNCNAPPVASTPKVGNIQFFVHSPKVPTTSTSGSPAGTANWTGSGLTRDCVANYRSGETNPGQSVAHTPYSTESEQVNNEVVVKIQPEFTLLPQEGSRPRLGQTGRGEPEDMGAGQPVFGKGFWGSATTRGVSRNPYVDRTFVAPQQVTIYSYFAYVSSGAVSTYGLSLPKGATTTGIYGAEACATIGAGAGVQKQWQCDPALWYPNGPDSVPRDIRLGKDPADPTKGYPVGRRVGDAYNLRDVDCLDESVMVVRDLGVHYGALSGTRCMR